jgi:hypothetical protein
MARPRSKPDFTAGVVVSGKGIQRRILELQIRSDNLYAIQPQRKMPRKGSHQALEPLRRKAGESMAITAMTELRLRFAKERAFQLGHEPRHLFGIDLADVLNAPQYTGQLYDRRIDLKLPKTDGSFVLELYLGVNSGKRLASEAEGYAEATIAERSFSGAGYDFCLRLAVVSSQPVYRWTVDEHLVGAWLNAATDLGIRVVAPFPVPVSGEESLLYEAHILDFGGPRGMVVGLLDRDDIREVRRVCGYAASNLSPDYRRYARQLFIDTLNDWQWFGEKGAAPSWYTGKKWAG